MNDSTPQATRHVSRTRLFTQTPTAHSRNYDVYDPKGNGKDKAVRSVHFVEAEPPFHLRGIVHRFLQLKTVSALAEEYQFHALPDACAYLVFNQLDCNITGASTLRGTSEEFSLGRTFHFVNIRFLLGVWQSSGEPISYGMVNKPYRGDLPLVEVNTDLSKRTFADQQPILARLVDFLVENRIVVVNPVTEKILQNVDAISSVADMALVSGLSARQLQRTLQRTTGFAPHDFLKVLRLQQALNGRDRWSYADQSHFIHLFRKATGYTPGRYSRKFDV